VTSFSTLEVIGTYLYLIGGSRPAEATATSSILKSHILQPSESPKLKSLFFPKIYKYNISFSQHI